MNGPEVLGGLMLTAAVVGAYVASFVLISRHDGWRTAVAVTGVAVFIIAWVMVGGWLLSGGDWQ